VSWFTKETGTMSAAENKQIITAAMAGLAKGDSRLFADAMAEDFSWRAMGRGAWGKVYEGKRVVRTQLFTPLYAQYADRATTTATGIFADGDYVIVEALGAATMKSGKAYNNKYCLIIRMKNGKMLEVREYLDTALSDEMLDASVL
jgi:uncharacterized protein